jgi:hypothetical protein
MPPRDRGRSAGSRSFSAAGFKKKAAEQRPWRHPPDVGAGRRPSSGTGRVQLQALTAERAEKLQAYLSAQLADLPAGAGQHDRRASARAGFLGEPGGAEGRGDGHSKTGQSLTSSEWAVASAPSLGRPVSADFSRWPARQSSSAGDRRGHVRCDPITPDLDASSTAINTAEHSELLPVGPGRFRPRSALQLLQHAGPETVGGGDDESAGPAAAAAAMRPKSSIGLRASASSTERLQPVGRRRAASAGGQRPSPSPAPAARMMPRAAPALLTEVRY